MRRTRMAPHFVFWLQDIYSQAIERLLGRGIPLGGRLIASRFARLERLTAPQVRGRGLHQ